MQDNVALREALATAIVNATKEAKMMMKRWESAARQRQKLLNSQTIELKELRTQVRNLQREVSDCDTLRRELTALQGKLEGLQQILVKQSISEVHCEGSELPDTPDHEQGRGSDNPCSPAGLGNSQGSCQTNDVMAHKKQLSMSVEKEYAVQMMSITYHSLVCLEQSTLRLSAALEHACNFLLWGCEYEGEDPVIAHFSKLAIKICCLDHQLFLHQGILPEKLEEQFSKMVRGIIANIMPPTGSSAQAEESQEGSVLKRNTLALALHLLKAAKSGPLIFAASASQLALTVEDLVLLRQDSKEGGPASQLVTKCLLLISFLQAGLKLIEEWDLETFSPQKGFELCMDSMQSATVLAKNWPLLVQNLTRLVKQMMGAIEDLAMGTSTRMSEARHILDSSMDFVPRSEEEKVWQGAQELFCGKQ